MKIRNKFEFFLSAFIFLGLCFSLSAKDYTARGPFPLRTQHPVYLQTVDLLPTRANILSPGWLEFRLDSTYSNVYEVGTKGATDIQLDGEWYRLGIVAIYGLLPSFEVGFEIPLFRFEGGFLDGAIQDFHNFFGFPNGGREQVANGLFQYRVKTANIDFNVGGEGGFDVGDFSIFSKHLLVEEEKGRPALAWRFIFKFPTGDFEKGLGGGEPGFGLGLALEKHWGRFASFLNANYLMDGGNVVLEDLMETLFFDFMLAGEFQFSKKLSALLQLQGGTPRLKNTGLDTWEGIPMDLVVGVSGAHPLDKKGLRNFFWQLAFSEDVTAKGPSVDFSVLGSLGVRFPLKTN